MTTEACKHCGEQIADRGSGYFHVSHRFTYRCAIEPYGFHAEPVGTPCGDDPVNPCLGSRAGRGTTQ